MMFHALLKALCVALAIGLGVGSGVAACKGDVIVDPSTTSSGTTFYGEGSLEGTTTTFYGEGSVEGTTTTTFYGEGSFEGEGSWEPPPWQGEGSVETVVDGGSGTDLDAGAGG